MLEKMRRFFRINLKKDGDFDDQERKEIQFILTGSNARKLKQSGVDLLAGRAIIQKDDIKFPIGGPKLVSKLTLLSMGKAFFWQ